MVLKTEDTLIISASAICDRMPGAVMISRTVDTLHPQTLGISPRDLEGLKADIAFMYVHGARLLTGDFATNFG